MATRKTTASSKAAKTTTKKTSTKPVVDVEAVEISKEESPITINIQAAAEPQPEKEEDIMNPPTFDSKSIIEAGLERHRLRLTREDGVEVMTNLLDHVIDTMVKEGGLDPLSAQDISVHGMDTMLHDISKLAKKVDREKARNQRQYDKLTSKQQKLQKRMTAVERQQLLYGTMQKQQQNLGQEV